MSNIEQGIPKDEVHPHDPPSKKIDHLVELDETSK
jgi:hypothetical protein